MASAVMQPGDGGQPPRLSERGSSWLLAALVLTTLALSLAAAFFARSLGEVVYRSLTGSWEILGLSVEDLIIGAFFAWMAKLARRPPLLGFISGSLLGPLPTIVLIAIFPARAEQGLSWQCPECRVFNEPDAQDCPCGYTLEADQGLSWQCPKCRVFNEPDAQDCPCGYRLEADTSPTVDAQKTVPPRKQKGPGPGELAIVVAAFLYLGILYDSSAILAAAPAYAMGKIYRNVIRRRIAKSQLSRSDRAVALLLCVVAIGCLTLGIFEVNNSGTEASERTSQLLLWALLALSLIAAIWGAVTTLFQPERALSVLERFVGVGIEEPDLSERANASPKLDPPGAS